MISSRDFRKLSIIVLTLAIWVRPSSPRFGLVMGQDGEPAFRQALQEFRQGEKQAAAVTLREILKTHPDHAPSHELLGLSLSALGKSEEAEIHLREATQLWPHQPVYWTNLGIFYLGRSQTVDAEAALRKSLEVAPSPPAYRLLGLIRLDQNLGGEAVQLFSKALALAPDDVDSWYYLGLAQHSLAHSEDALRCYQEVLKRDSRHFHAQLQIGTLLLTQGQRQQALEHLKAAEALRPQNAEVYERLGEAFLVNGNLQQALDAARHAVELMPFHRQPHYQLALVLARLGKSDESRKEFAISEGLPPEPEVTPLERWRELHAEGPKSDASKP